MERDIEKEIIEAEENLRTAMLISNLEVLDQLLAPDLIFTNHLGQLISKNDDLAGHKTGIFKIDQLEASERHIQIKEQIAIVSVRMQLSGSYKGVPTGGSFRFTRVWAQTKECQWQVIAGHSSIIA